MQMELSYVFAVVITGLVVVFLGLVLLIAFITAIGAIFKKIDAKKKAQSEAKPADTPKAVSASAPVPAASGTDDDEVIAVISAAVAMMSAADGTTYRVKSVRAAKNGSSGNAWASAALREATRPF